MDTLDEILIAKKKQFLQALAPEFISKKTEAQIFEDANGDFFSIRYWEDDCFVRITVTHDPKEQKIEC